VKYLLIFLLVLAIFVISVTLGAQNGWLICGLFWLRVRVSLARAERKIKRLENQLSPATDVAVVPHSSAAKE